MIVHFILTGTYTRAAGTLDSSFSGDGIQTTAFTTSSQARGVVIQSDGKIVAAGYAMNAAGTNTDFAAVRYNADGTVDGSYGTAGKTTVDFGFSGFGDNAVCMAIQGDGKVLIAGEVNNGANQDFGIARLKTDGTLDPTFDTNAALATAGAGSGKVRLDWNLGGPKHDRVTQVLVQSDGKIVCVGYAYSSTTGSVIAIARYNSNGALDLSFDGDGKLTTSIAGVDDGASAAVLQSDGKIVVGGGYKNGTTYDLCLLRYLANGALDPTFGTSGKVLMPVGAGNEDIIALALQPDGKIVAAAEYITGTADYDWLLLRFNTDGSNDNTFDGDGRKSYTFGSGNDLPRSVLVQPDGKIVAVGQTNNGTNDDMAILRVNADGSADASFDGDGKLTLAPGSGMDRLFAVTMDANGNLVGAGLSDISSGGNSNFAVIRVIAQSTPGIWNVVAAQGSGGTNLGITGQINPANLSTTVTVEYGTTNAFGTTQSIGTFTGNTLQNFSATLYPGGLTMGTTYYYHIVATNTNGTTTTAAQTLVYAPGALDLTFSGDGVQITPFNDGATLRVAQARAVAIQSDGKVVSAGWKSNGTNDDSAIVRYNVDGSLDATFGAGGQVITPLGADDGFYAVSIQPDGKIVAAGTAYTGTSNEFALVRYNSNGTLDTTFDSDPVKAGAGTGSGKVFTAFDLGGIKNDVILGMALQPDGKIVAAGYAYKSTAVDIAIARYNPNGTLDTSFDGDGKLNSALGSPNSQARSVTIQPDGKILIGCMIDNGTNYDIGLVRYTATGGLDGTFGSGGKVTFAVGSGDDSILSIALQPDGKIIAAGNSINAGKADGMLYRFLANGAVDTFFDGDGRKTVQFSTNTDFLRAIALQPDGKIVAAGSANAISNIGDMGIVRVNSDGSYDTSFDGDGKLVIAPGPQNDQIAAVALDGNANLVAVGLSENANSVAQFAMVRVLGFPQPGVWKLDASPAISAPGVTVSGQIDPSGSGTAVNIEYGPTASLGLSSNLGTFTGSGLQSLITTLNFAGLTSGSTVYYRISATNANGTTTTAVQSYVVPYTYEVVASLPGGSGPIQLERGPLYVASDGTIYGASNRGGTNNLGTIFKVSPTGSITVLVNFTGIIGPAMGENPAGGLVPDGAGNLWGTTQYGGGFNYGTIYKYNLASDTLTTVVQFAGTTTIPRGRRPLRELVSDASGFYWGMTYKGGANDLGTVFKINKTTGAFSTVTEFAGINNAPKGDGGDQPLTFDGINTMWGTSSAGGFTNVGTLFKINTSTGALTTVKEFTGTTGAVLGSDPDSTLVFETPDVLWGTTWAGGTSDQGTIFTYTISTNTFSTLFNLNAATGTRPVAGFYRDDAHGLMWNTASHDGANAMGTLFTINRTGTRALTPVAAFTGTSGITPGSIPFGAIMSDGQGNLIGTTLNGGPADSGVIYRIRFGPTPFTTAATNISGYTAVLNGTVNPNGTATTFRFAYGSTPSSLTNYTPVQSLSATRTLTPVSTAVQLASNATFYYRLEAENAEQIEKQVGATLSLNMPALPGDANRTLAAAQLTLGASYHYVSNQTGEVSGGVGAAWDIKPGINYFEDKLLDAAAKYRLAISEAPSNPEGHRGLIQTVYERLVAQTFEGNTKFADTAKIRLDLGTAGNGVGGPIDAEIASYSLARDKYQAAVNIFLTLARDPVEGTYLFPSVQPSGLWQQTPPPGAPRSLAAEASRLFEAFARAFGILSRTEARLRQLMYFRAYRDPASNPNGFQPRAAGGFLDTVTSVADNLEEIQLLASLYTHLDSYDSADLPEASGGISDLRKLAGSAGSKNVFFSFGFDKNLVSSFSEYTPGFVPFLFAQGAYASSRSFDNLYDFANELVTISAGTDGTGGRDAAARTATQAAVDNWIQLKQKTQQIKSDYEARLIELCGQRLVPVDPAVPNGPTKIAPDLLGYAFRPDVREIDPAIQQKGAIYAQWQKIELARTRYSQAVQDFVDLGTEIDIIEQSAAEQAAVPIAAGRNVAKIIYSTGEQIVLLQKQMTEAVSEYRLGLTLAVLEAENKDKSKKTYAALKSNGVGGLGSVSDTTRSKEYGKEVALFLKQVELGEQLSARLGDISIQSTNIYTAQQAQIAFTYAMSAAEGIELRAKERIRTVLVKSERLKLSILLAQQEFHAQEIELGNMLGRVDFLLQEYRQALLLESENAMLKPDFRFLRDQAMESASDAFRFAQEWVYLTAKAAQYRFMTPAQFATASTLIERTLIARKGVELRDILTSLKALSNNFYLNGIPGNGQVKKVVLSLRDYLVQNNLVSRDARGQLIAGAPASFQPFPAQGGTSFQSISDREWTAFLARNITGFPSAPKLTLTFSTSMEPGYEGRSNPLWFGDQFGQFIVSGTEPGAKGLFVNILGDLPAPTVLQPPPEVQVSQEGACYIPFKSWNSWAPGEFAMRIWTLPKRTTSPTALIAQDSLSAFTTIEPFANEEMNERSPYCDHWTLVVDGRQGYGKVLLTTNLDKIKDIQIGLSIKGFTGQ